MELEGWVECEQEGKALSHASSAAEHSYPHISLVAELDVNSPLTALLLGERRRHIWTTIALIYGEE